MSVGVVQITDVGQKNSHPCEGGRASDFISPSNGPRAFLLPAARFLSGPMSRLDEFLSRSPMTLSNLTSPLKADKANVVSGRATANLFFTAAATAHSGLRSRITARSVTRG